MSRPYYILSLDGGGSLGVYTLGVLIEIERMLDQPLHEVFGLVYGTSTGSIIASMIALGDDVEKTIHDRYFDLAPDVMGRWLPRSKSAALERHAEEIYGDKTFDHFVTNVGIVGTHLEFNRPTVFKRTVTQSHGSSASFLPGFGCKIADAVVSSCAAYPVFQKKHIKTPNHGDRDVIDGGFVANNPALFALTDALGPLEVERDDIRMLSIGTGSFPERWRAMRQLFAMASPAQTIMTLLKTSSNTVETLRGLLFKDINTLRIDDAYTDALYRTDFMEARPKQLKRIFQLGRKSFEGRERDLRTFFELPV